MSGPFESVQWNACVLRLDLELYSNRKEFWGEWCQNQCQLQGNNPLYKKNSPQRRIEPTTLHQAGQRAQHILILSYLSRSLADRWGTTVDFTTSFLHSSRFSAFRSVMFHGRPVHSLMLSSHRFLCLPLRLPP